MWSAGVSGVQALQILGQIEGALGQRRRQQVQGMRALLDDRAKRNAIPPSATDRTRGFIPPARMTRNLEIARRLAAGESGLALAVEYGMTHQNVYFLGKKYKHLAACPRGEGSVCKAEYAGSNPAAASS